MRTSLVFAAGLAALCLLMGCPAKKAPTVSVKNDMGVKVNVQVKPATGSTFNFNDVEGGTSVAAKDLVEGDTEVKASLQKGGQDVSSTFKAEAGKTYTVVLSGTDTPTIKVDIADAK
jgi:hypothetical protein